MICLPLIEISNKLFVLSISFQHGKFHLVVLGLIEVGVEGRQRENIFKTVWIWLVFELRR